jgi:aminopeptidase-like protein
MKLSDLPRGATPSIGANPDVLALVPDADGLAALGREMHALCIELFPINRSLAGPGFRQSLARLGECLPGLQTTHLPTGTQVLDWTVPREWEVHEAWLEGPDGRRVCDFADSNLHVVGYSVPVDRWLTLDELQPHLHSLPESPEAIPYITSYYAERWGFCLPHRVRSALPPGRYRAVIRSRLEAGHLTWGEWRIPGDSDEEVLLSSYLCHPSMANNELSGPVVTTWLARALAALPRRRFSYRVVIVPETIGAIAYLDRHWRDMKARTVAGFQVTCVGDDRAYSYLPSRLGGTLADRAALHALSHLAPDFRRYSFLDRGSDERQWCAPGIDLPVASVMRSKYGSFDEYHTSLDDLSLVTPSGLAGGYEAVARSLQCLELDERLTGTVLGEPQLGKRGLYPTLSTKTSAIGVQDMMNLLAYSDGHHSLLDIAEHIGTPLWALAPTVEQLKAHGLLVAA